LKRYFVFKLLTVHFEDIHSSSFDFCLQAILNKIVPFDCIKSFSFLISNDNVTAIFLAKYFAIKFSTGHSFRDIVSPVVRDLKRIVIKSVYLPHIKMKVDIAKLGNFLNYRSFIFKKLLFKNFLLYKLLSIKLFFLKASFFNFYMLWYFHFFFSLQKAFIIGFCKNFFFRKHCFNFFFNYDFNNFLEKIFSFFSLALSKFFSKFSFYFSMIFEDLFSNFNIIFQATAYFNVDLSGIKTASFFFNKVIIYNY